MHFYTYNVNGVNIIGVILLSPIPLSDKEMDALLTAVKMHAVKIFGGNPTVTPNKGRNEPVTAYQAGIMVKYLCTCEPNSDKKLLGYARREGGEVVYFREALKRGGYD